MPVGLGVLVFVAVYGIRSDSSGAHFGGLILAGLLVWAGLFLLVAGVGSYIENDLVLFLIGMLAMFSPGLLLFPEVRAALALLVERLRD